MTNNSLNWINNFSFILNCLISLKVDNIAVGGDIHTTAAITGAISGAYQGINAIPEGYAKITTIDQDLFC